MENSMKRYVFRVALTTYLLLYLIAIHWNQFVLMTILKPGAAVLAYYSFGFVIGRKKVFESAIKSMQIAFLLWGIVDFFTAIIELYLYYHHKNPIEILVYESAFYLFVRIALLIAAIRFYKTLTAKFNRFQRFTDVATITSCIMTTMWIIFFESGSVPPLDRIQNLDLNGIFSMIYRGVSLLIMGILLIAWFHYQYRKISYGQRLMILGTAGVAAVDLTVSFQNTLLLYNETMLMYKIAILCIAAGSELFFLHPAKTLFIRVKNEEERINSAWKNVIYLLSYPVLVVIAVGLCSEVFNFIFLYAFYIIASLYTRQLAITDRLLISEKEKNKQLRLYSNVIQQAPLSIIITNTAGIIEYVNPYFELVSGYQGGEIEGLNVNVLRSDSIHQDIYQDMWEQVSNGKKWVGEFTNRKKNGEEYQVRSIITGIKDLSGELTHFVGINEDITESMRMKNLIDNQSGFITQLVDVIPNAIFHISQDDLFLGANIEFQNIYQINAADYIGMNYFDTPWMNPEKTGMFIQMREESLAKQEPVIRQMTRYVNGLETPILFCVNAFYTSDGALGGYIGMMTDVSEMKRKEFELEKALLQANDATEAKSRFLANMSHEIRTPMNAVIGMSYLALKTDLTDKQRDYLNKIYNAAVSLLDIINDILDFSKIESGKITLEQVEFQIDHVMIQSIELLVQKAREKNLEVEYHLAPNIPRILKGDPLRLGQILTNLVSNAVKFTKEGGISIEAEEEQRIGDMVLIRIAITDTGIGISEKDQQALFEAFTQSDNSITRQYGGTGLGLAICRNLVELMNGKIWIESTLGKGSKFTFTAWFQLVKERIQEEGLPDFGSEKIKTMIVEPNPTSGLVLQEYLRAMKIGAQVVGSGKEALFHLDQESQVQPYQLIFVDWEIPDMECIELIRGIEGISQMNQTFPTILVTTYEQMMAQNQTQGLPVKGFLSKPITQTNLAEVMKTVLRQEESSLGKKQESFRALHGASILLVEDHQVNQQIACELLTSVGCNVDIANNGKEAVDMMQSQDVPYQLILMDIQMPVMDGFEATSQIRQRFHDIPIIAMTARTMKEEQEKCLACSMNDHISKPINPEILFSVVEKWLNHKDLPKGQTLSQELEASRKEPQSLIAITNIDTQMGLARVNGKVDLYHRILRLYVTEDDNLIRDLKKYTIMGNYEELDVRIHKLKGVSGNIGANVVYELCRSIEKKLKERESFVTIQPELHVLIDELESEFQQIREVFQITETQEQVALNLSKEIPEGKEVLNHLMELLQNSSAETDLYFQANRQVLRNSMNKNEFRSIANDIYQKDFSKAFEVLAELVRRHSI